MKSHWKRKRVERKEQINKGRAQWRNDEQFYRSSNSKRLRKGAIQKPYTHKQVLDIFGANCHICKEPIDLQATRMTGRPGWERGLHIDHVIPLSKGGDDTLENVKPSHGRCNVEKSATLA
jgi:5-methylcytosine-specific restriction endonuclease McrA